MLTFSFPHNLFDSSVSSGAELIFSWGASLTVLSLAHWFLPPLSLTWPCCGFGARIQLRALRPYAISDLPGTSPWQPVARLRGDDRGGERSVFQSQMDRLSFIVSVTHIEIRIVSLKCIDFSSCIVINKWGFKVLEANFRGFCHSRMFDATAQHNQEVLSISPAQL